MPVQARARPNISDLHPVQLRLCSGNQSPDEVRLAQQVDVLLARAAAYALIEGAAVALLLARLDLPHQNAVCAHDLRLAFTAEPVTSQFGVPKFGAVKTQRRSS